MCRFQVVNRGLQTRVIPTLLASQRLSWLVEASRRRSSQLLPSSAATSSERSTVAVLLLASRTLPSSRVVLILSLCLCANFPYQDQLRHHVLQLQADVEARSTCQKDSTVSALALFKRFDGAKRALAQLSFRTWVSVLAVHAAC